jgi:hypothetical protein
MSRLSLLTLSLGLLLAGCGGAPEDVTSQRSGLAVAPEAVLSLDLPGCEGLGAEVAGLAQDPVLAEHPTDSGLLVVSLGGHYRCVDSPEVVWAEIEQAMTHRSGKAPSNPISSPLPDSTSQANSAKMTSQPIDPSNNERGSTGDVLPIDRNADDPIPIFKGRTASLSLQ